MAENKVSSFFRRLIGAEPEPVKPVPPPDEKAAPPPVEPTPPEPPPAEPAPPEPPPPAQPLFEPPTASLAPQPAELESERPEPATPPPEAPPTEVEATPAPEETVAPVPPPAEPPPPSVPPPPEPPIAPAVEAELEAAPEPPVSPTAEAELETPPEPPAPPDQILAGPPEASVDYVEQLEQRPAAETPGPRRSWLQRLTSGLKRSSDQLTGGITAIFTKKRLDAATLDELEDILIQADFGLDTTEAVIETLRRDRFNRDISAEDVRDVLAAEIEQVLAPVAKPLVIEPAKKPFVILMVGVNGTGKTTTIGKLAATLRAEGKSVMLAAGDTFRAAAIEQLQVWGQRTGAEVVARPAGSDASGLAFDAVTRAKAEAIDVLIIDTAGRLQNRDELMSELEKIIRVIRKVEPEAPHATLLTLDATTGQNALNQVEIFGKRAGVTGLVMTKLDGTARGGILVAIARKFGLPVHFIGVGESVDDLEPFAAKDFAAAIAGRED
jgi:fused signal recognition particle receptor